MTLGDEIRFSAGQINQIGAEAEAAYPDECCGLLVGVLNGHVYEVSRVVASPNVAEARAHDRFEVDPQVRIDLMRELRHTDQSIIGHYHSHPDHGAVPSETDLAQAYEPELVWVITSVLAGQARESAGHVLDPATGRFRQIELRVDGAVSGF